MDTQPPSTKRYFSKKRNLSLKAQKRIEDSYTPGNHLPIIKTWKLVWKDLEDAMYWSLLRYLYGLYSNIPSLHQLFMEHLAMRAEKPYFRAAFMEEEERLELKKIKEMDSIEVICYFEEGVYNPRTAWFVSKAAYIERVKHLPGIVLSVVIDPAIIVAYLEMGGLHCVVITAQEFIDHVAELRLKTLSDVNS